MRLKKVPGALERIRQSSYFIEEPKEYKGKWNALFKNDNEIHIEIGMGKGHFIVNMAKRYPQVNFIGIEMYDSVLVRAVQALEDEENSLDNLKLILLDAKNIEEVFEHEITTLYLNFSDPWPKAKHAKRRLTSPIFLEKYDTIFKDKKTIIQKTDNMDLFEYSIEMLKNKGYNLIEITYDLESFNDETNVPTEYEEKFMAKGMKINRLKAIQ